MGSDGGAAYLSNLLLCVLCIAFVTMALMTFLSRRQRAFISF